MKKILMLAAMIGAMIFTSMPVSAKMFTPSVEAKPAPAISVRKETDDGRKIIAEIKDKEDKIVHDVEEGHILITPIAEAEKAPVQIFESLKRAYTQIKESVTLKDIVPDIEKSLENILEDFNLQLEAESTPDSESAGKPGEKPAEKPKKKELKVGDLVVRDLFDVSLDEESRKHLEAGNFITLDFELGVKKDELVICLHNKKDKKWEVIDSSRVKNNGDGTVSVTFDSLSPVAFVVEKSEELKKQEMEEMNPDIPSKETDVQDTSYPLLWAGVGVGAVSFSGLLIFLIFILKKKSKNKDQKQSK